MTVRDIAKAMLDRADEDWTWIDPEQIKALAEFVWDNTHDMEPFDPNGPRLADIIGNVEPMSTPLMDMLKRGAVR